ncbi:glycosyl transferase [Candidimonas sp. SYP-B2681]|uniref:GH36-type glycosyl hydrolase domain-containing protein n=1 Tax=Candidimonas sp. SYP-B2681 TaxID=2497686 RepID=UPI000F87CC88|nr:glucoamylase family protein [Candidimonas sp. SYP-B2681]RTZ42569.1 glycosyl transferase [Candidimonas sp. SYP-B2681]
MLSEIPLKDRFFQYLSRSRARMGPWHDRAPVRAELFGIERLEQHAQSLAAAQSITGSPPHVSSLQKRLNENAAVLLTVYRGSARELESGRSIVPAAEWLLDNYHLVEQHVREIREDLPPGFYRQLPKLAGGPFAGYPRVFGLAWAFVAHTDSNFDPDTLRRFIASYQRIQPLAIGELWAVAITLRIVLIENLRRLADQISDGQKALADAELLVARLLDSKNVQFVLETKTAPWAATPLPDSFAAHLAKRLRDLDPRTTPALVWLEERLTAQNTSIDDVVLDFQQRQGASNVSVRNIITSMRLISDIDWTELVEKVSHVDERLREASSFARMDFPTRNLYRNAVEKLARGSSLSELEVVDRALDAARMARAQTSDELRAQRVGDPGYYLIAEGRPDLEREIGFKPPLRLRLSRLNVRLGIRGYVSIILLLTAAFLGAALSVLWIPGMAIGWLAVFLLAAFFPASELATALLNRAVSWTFDAVILPGLELKGGVPHTLRTLVVIPTLLSSRGDLLEQIERLEVHYLGDAGGDLSFALLLDGIDADREVVPGEEQLLAVAVDAFKELNSRYGLGPAGDRFVLLYRRRIFNPSENKWMGWERKRGKLHELNRLLRGATDTTFIPVGQPSIVVPADVRYVITLDADTRLPRDVVLRLVGKMAHPLNRPLIDAAQQRVVKGYAILQPRVTPALPIGREGSIYQRVISSPAGIDPYAAAISDVYQDLFGEGSYTGKGIYDVDAFEAALTGRIPENALLSHDLFEGVFARAGLVSDVEVIEEAPSRYDVAVKRQHRWTRGDWQLVPWLFDYRKGGATIPSVGRGKMLDNLRRSLMAPASMVALVCSWCLPMPASAWGTLLILACISVTIFLPALFSIVPRRKGIGLRSHMLVLASDFRLAAIQTLLALVFLADHAWRMCDAIIRTLIRLFITRRNLLEWTTAAQSSGGPLLDLWGFYKEMAGSTLLALVLTLSAVIFVPASGPLALPFILLWASAPWFALWASQPQLELREKEISGSDVRRLRLMARQTWRFFETFVTPADNMLPPDNFQEEPRPVLAHRTSPTNISLYLMSAIAARDFGWAGAVQTVERLEATILTMQKLARFKGHYFNWYDTEDLRPLEPAYVSSVDSGNLAGHLIVIANACEEWINSALLINPRPGVRDNLQLARRTVATLPAASGEHGRQINALLDEIEVKLDSVQADQVVFPTLKRPAEKALKALMDVLPATENEDSANTLFWFEALSASIAEYGRDRLMIENPDNTLPARLQSLADTAREMALIMDFGFLLNHDRKLLSIGYRHDDNTLDPNCYDLLASEARLASLFAIAKGDVATRHWMRLGRMATPLDNGAALVSWSGSMFEYLMPSLVMRAPYGSLLEQTNRLVVAHQQAYGKSLNIPWGISESAYNARDMEFTLQYSNFGVPGLGLKRGLAEDVVVAPYATGLAAMVDAAGASENYRHLSRIGARGRYGFYEALDYTPSRLPENKDVAIVRNYMSHHQGMTIVAIANTLLEGRMRTRFHREPMIQACESLLQERMPRDVIVTHPRAEEVRVAAGTVVNNAATVRRHLGAPTGAPITHLLSNGRYTVMLTTSGGGASRWRDIAVTRWREDATCDGCGSFIFLRDMRNGKVWSAGLQPLAAEMDHEEVIFAEDYAQFIRRDGNLTTTMDVLVSGEDDGEVRRVSLTNSGHRPREIEVTSYAEIVLTAASADMAHPVFAKMFVTTSHLEEFASLVATRRRRSPDEPELWAAHFAVVEGEAVGEPQYESDRASFIGRGRSVAAAGAMEDDQPLSGTTGTVLDPIFALRYRLLIAPGKVARIAFWTVVASSEAELMDMIDKHHDRSAFERAKTLAWTQAQVQLRHLDMDADEAADFQRMAAPILYADPRYRASSEAIRRGAGPQSGLWPYAISGDLPIVLLRINDIQDIGRVRQLLRAHEYWRMKRLAVDLVIVNERASSYVQDLQNAIETAVRSSRSRPRFGGELAQGAVFALRADLMTVESRNLLQSVARIALLAHRGPIAEQLARIPKFSVQSETVSRLKAVNVVSLLPTPSGLEFFNGLGGFDKGGHEYVTILNDGDCTPAPWINVIANPDFGFQVATEGSAYTWALNSRENQLTPWSNDPVEDRSGEVIYILDETTRQLWTPTAHPIRDKGSYIARHGRGYSRFEHEVDGIAAQLLQYVPLSDPIKISRLSLRNASGKSRSLTITCYAEWVLGTFRGASGPFVVSSIDTDTGAMLARNPWSTAFPGLVAFADLAGRQTTWTADRTEFIGHNRTLAEPKALLRRDSLSGATGAGMDPCAALQTVVNIEPGETVEVVWFLGQCRSLEATRELITRYRQRDLDSVFMEIAAHWDSVLGAVQVKTPDRATDILLNGWLLYQTLACRIWARSAFYQASGAYGFRDQLQDGMALTFAQPQTVRAHLLRAAGRQFVEGDVQHWWLPHSGQGVRTHISDDRVWLAYATATYIARTGDLAVLDENVPFLEGQILKTGEHDAFFQPMVADESGSLFEHCARGLDQCLALTGERGLPLMGTGDWNDGMNRVGEGGKGESVWLGWLLWRTIDLFLPLAKERDAHRSMRWQEHAVKLKESLESKAWDGEWYRRAIFDDGSWLGSKHNQECRIDSIAQSWAVLSGAADPERAAAAMAALEQQLVRHDQQIALLFTPPFDKSERDPGYIKAYPPGLRENGGQYSHAAMWAILAWTKLGMGDKAFDLFKLLNPINHARSPDEVERYKVEPYVVAADVYSTAPHVGRGGWTWYTGSAAWMYRAGVEGILGIRREGGFLVIAPCLPVAWPAYDAEVKFGSASYDIRVENARRLHPSAVLDGMEIGCANGKVRVLISDGSHRLSISI